MVSSWEVLSALDNAVNALKRVADLFYLYECSGQLPDKSSPEGREGELVKEEHATQGKEAIQG